MMEKDDLHEVYNIDPTPSPQYTLESMYLFRGDVTSVDGLMTHTYMFSPPAVVPPNSTSNFTTLEEFEGVMYNIHSHSTNSMVRILPRVPQQTTQDVHVYI